MPPYRLIKAEYILNRFLGDIYLYFVCERKENEAAARTGKSVGFDFGLKKFMNGSDGIDIEAPLFFKQNRNAIAKANRNLSRKQKGSNNRNRARLALARLHRRTANQRSAFHWHIASQLAGEYSFICLEGLNLKAMQRMYGRKISDLGFADFVCKLKYMAGKAGSTVVEIYRFYPSSQLCSVCGYQNKEIKNLKISEWECPHCRANHNRDRNAAINILREGERTFLGI